MGKGQAGWHQDQENFFRGIGHGGERVGGKDGESEAFGEPFVFGLGGLEGIADQPTLENHGKDYRTNRGGTSGELDRRPGGEIVGAKSGCFLWPRAHALLKNTNGIKGIDTP